jgi:hypothetical protein
MDIAFSTYLLVKKSLFVVTGILKANASIEVLMHSFKRVLSTKITTLLSDALFFLRLLNL